ncbi:MAG: hypothetical protein AAF846_29990 [Chloroflexota bacterium]
MLGFFLIWMMTFVLKTVSTYRAGHFDIPAVRDLWSMTLGVGIGIFIYNYELEYLLQQHLEFLPFSLSSLRAIVSLMLVVFFYYHAIDKHTQFSINKRMKPFLVICTVIIILIDFIFHDQYPCEKFQIWMTLLIIPPTLIASFLIADITKTILKEEVAPLNRAHYYWWILELLASSLSALIFLGDAMYKASTSTYVTYTPSVVVAQCFYLVLALAAQARVMLPPEYTRYIFYFEKLVLYLRLRWIRLSIERKIDLQHAYNYEQVWIPTYERLELEIRRSFISITDTVNYLGDIDPDLGKQLTKIRAARKPYSETINDILRVQFS